MQSNLRLRSHMRIICIMRPKTALICKKNRNIATNFTFVAIDFVFVATNLTFFATNFTFVATVFDALEGFALLDNDMSFVKVSSEDRVIFKKNSVL